MNIRLTNVSKSFMISGFSTFIFKDFFCEIDRGSKTAIVGASGSGKTTLLSIIGLLSRASTGAIQINGEDMYQLSAVDFFRFRARNIGFIFQQSHLINYLNTLDNVALPLVYQDFSLYNARADAETLLREVGLGHRLKNYPSQLSGGERQRTMIARALVGKPAIVIADEPTSALDPIIKDQIIGLIKDYVFSNSATLIMSTHDYRMLNFFDNVIDLSK